MTDRIDGAAPDKDERVTLVLQRWRRGDEAALEELMPVIYQELRRLARAQLSGERKASIQATELVGEAYLKLIHADQIDWQDRNHFLSVAARAMRQILVERFRKRSAQRRGGGQTLLTLNEEIAPDPGHAVEIELDRLDDALTELDQLDPRQAEIVTMKFFGGLKVSEIASVLEVSDRTVKREWAMARRWLFRRLARD